MEEGGWAGDGLDSRAQVDLTSPEERDGWSTLGRWNGDGEGELEAKPGLGATRAPGVSSRELKDVLQGRSRRAASVAG